MRMITSASEQTHHTLSVTAEPQPGNHRRDQRAPGSRPLMAHEEPPVCRALSGSAYLDSVPTAKSRSHALMRHCGIDDVIRRVLNATILTHILFTLAVDLSQQIFRTKQHLPNVYMSTSSLNARHVLSFPQNALISRSTDLMSRTALLGLCR